MRRQIDLAPARRRLRADDEAVGAGIVGDQLRAAGGDEIGIARVRDLERQMQRRDGSEHLGLFVRRRARRQIAAHAEGELGLDDPHAVGAEGDELAVLVHGLREQAAGDRPVDADMPLAGEAGRRDLPAVERRGAQRLDLGLDQIALLATGRAQVRRQCFQHGAVPPMAREQLRRGLGRCKLHFDPYRAASETRVSASIVSVSSWTPAPTIQLVPGTGRR